MIFSIERVLAVVKPLQFRDQQSAARARIIVLCTALYAALVSLSIPVMRYYTLSHGELDSYEGTVGNIFAKFPPWLETWNSVMNMYMVRNAEGRSKRAREVGSIVLYTISGMAHNLVKPGP